MNLILTKYIHMGKKANVESIDEANADKIFDKSRYKSLMFYNTTIRNVGLYTSIAIALLGYASRLKSKTAKLTKLFFLLASGSFLIIAIYLNYTMYHIMEDYISKSPGSEKEMAPWMRISLMVFPIHFVIFTMIVGYLLFNLENLRK